VTDTQRHTQCIDLSGEGAAGVNYCVRVGGTVDGQTLRDPVGYANYGQSWENNLWTRLLNTGTEAVINPWIHVDGQHRWHDIEQILEEVLGPGLGPGMSDADKARAIWDFARGHRYHCTTGDDEVKDTVKMLNVYGYTLCWDEAYTLSNLWQAAGLKIRRGLPHGHCTTEVFYDDTWHLLDSDEHLLVLGRDNETIVGETEISRDHDLMKRSHGYGILSPENRAVSESAASLFCYAGGRAGTRPRIGDHRMDLVLRPGEALTWGWKNQGRYHGYGAPPPRFCNGALTWSPPLDSTFARWTEAAQSATSDGECLTADSVTWRLQSPYVIVGGELELVLGASAATVDLSRDGNSWTTVADNASGAVNIKLDEHFANDTPATYSLYLRLTGAGHCLSRLQIELTLQMAPLSLPGLHLGDNMVSYTDRSMRRQIEVTHAWQERDDLVAPDIPVPQSPVQGTIVAGSTPTLSWSHTCGKGGDYQVRLGADAQMHRALSPIFEKLVSQTPSKGLPQWTVPEAGLLNPDTPYYWKVRARSGAGMWGLWSKPAHFTTKEPGVPLAVHLDVDWASRQGVLRWQANPRGATPTHFEIYGCDERGFSISREPYVIVAGDSEPNGKRSMAPNLLSETQETTAVVVGSHAVAGNRAFFRVVAVDADGSRSGPSDYAEAPRPFIFSPIPSQIPAGTTTIFRLETIRSIGDLRAESNGPRRYHMAIRDGDSVSFVLDEGPEFTELDTASGTLTFRPEPRHASTHTVTIRAKNGQGGVDVIGFDLVVTA